MLKIPISKLIFAVDGKEALEFITNNVTNFKVRNSANHISLISLIIADYNVPEISGLDVITQASKHYKDNNLENNFPKVIMLTGIND